MNLTHHDQDTPTLTCDRLDLTITLTSAGITLVAFGLKSLLTYLRSLRHAAERREANVAPSISSTTV